MPPSDTIETEHRMHLLRKRCIENAHAELQDCFVVGGGINGAVTAAALAGKGAKVTVIDKSDFASFTSQESSNLAWGGIKYLETCEFGLVWGLCKCRNRLMKNYPDHVREIRFFTSIAKGFRKPRLLVYLGALLYWFMGRCQTRPPRLLSRKAIQREAPMINAEHLSGGLEYSDCYFVENDARFVFGFIRTVLKNGSNAINYAELVSATWKDGIWHCTLRDHESDEEFIVRTKILINAAGPFADRINTLLGIDSAFKHIFSKGVHIIVPQVTPVEHVLTFFASDGRLFFMVPMGTRTCIGTTDTRVENASVEATPDDIDFLLSNANTLLALEKELTRNDVIATRCGVRPLVVKRDADVGHVEWTALSRKHEIDVHPDRKTLTIYGGKLTDCLNVGDEVAEIVESFGIRLNPTKKYHGKVHDRELFRDSATNNTPLIGNYSRNDLQRMAREEMVVHLEDFLRRRTMLELTLGRTALRANPGLTEAARILFGDEAEAELERYSKAP